MILKFQIKKRATKCCSNWDQIDGEKTVSPPINTSTVGPAFVSKFPSTNQERYLPNLETVLSGSTPK